MDFREIITAKKLGGELTGEQITQFARGAADGSIPDYQLTALLMAIRLRGMTARETSDLTLAMAQSGDMLTLDVDGVPVDKHSTGGVGDTTTLVLAPLVAACGGKVAKMSGRGLGHTGGTIDKLESIPGMRTELSEAEFLRVVREVGACVIGQSRELAPADKTLYELRNDTATVDAIPLIASSILSKKLAAGARAIVLDVKTGSGAIMETLEESIALAEMMVKIGEHAGRQIVALVTGMREPLGTHIGNALEVKEAIDILAGRAKGPLLAVSLALGAQMLTAAGVAKNTKEAEGLLTKALESGAGLRKMRDMIAAQGGDARVCDDVSLLPTARLRQTVQAVKGGYIQDMDAQVIGYAAQGLGAGRATKGEALDHAVGLVMRARIGDSVQAGDPLCDVLANDETRMREAAQRVLASITVGDAQVPPAKLLYAQVTREGIQML